jgi:hypothetical protein
MSFRLICRNHRLIHNKSSLWEATVFVHSLCWLLDWYCVLRPCMNERSQVLGVISETLDAATVRLWRRTECFVAEFRTILWLYPTYIFFGQRKHGAQSRMLHPAGGFENGMHAVKGRSIPAVILADINQRASDNLFGAIGSIRKQSNGRKPCINLSHGKSRVSASLLWWSADQHP